MKFTMLAAIALPLELLPLPMWLLSRWLYEPDGGSTLAYGDALPYLAGEGRQDIGSYL